MKTLLQKLLMLLLFLPACLGAQWIARQNMASANKRVLSMSFSINGKIYVVGGQQNFLALSDVWEYNTASDTWTQKVPFPGTARGGSGAFSLGNKGYILCGSAYNGMYLDDVWEYDPVMDKWTQKGNFPGGQREELIAFTIGSKAYAGTGYEEIVGPNSVFYATYADFWEYDAVSDQWTQKALVPGQPRGWAIGASANGKGYVGLGSNSSQNQSYSDFYEFDPQANSWTPKASYGASLGDAICFTIGQEIYVCGGIDFGTMTGTAVFKKYNPVTDTWSSLPSMPAGVTMGGVGAAFNNRGFVGTGYSGGMKEKSDWWEFATSSTICPAPVAYGTATVTPTGSGACDGKIVISNITNGCAPYSVSIVPSTGTVVTLTGSGTDYTIFGLCAGNYTVKVMDNFCCGATTKSCLVPSTIQTGSGDLAGHPSLSIFPNPSEGSFEVRGVQQADKIRIVDALGREVVFKMQIQDSGLHIDLSANGKGVYFFSCKNAGVSIVRKIVVQ